MIAMTKQSTFDPAKLRVLTDQVSKRLDELFEVLGIDVSRSFNKYVGVCPVHGGDNPTALNIYYDDETYFGTCGWKCRTHQCEKHFSNGTLIGFVRGVLSNQKYDWASAGDPVVSFQDTLDFLLKFVETDYESLQANIKSMEKTRFISNASLINPQRPNITSCITRQQIRKALKIPAEYYLERKYSQSILDKYDVGLCTTPGKPMYNRIVVPVYDDDYQYMVGCTGRSIYKQCKNCKKWHSPGPCPPGVKEDKFNQYSKWKHSTNFDRDNYLYNYWRAQRHIRDVGLAIITESPGNVWRLEEAGIHNSVAIFGTALSNGQRFILDGSGALSLLLLMDNDEAGEKARQIITDQCNRIYQVYTLEYSGKDIGEMTKEDIKKEIIPFIQRIQL